MDFSDYASRFRLQAIQEGRDGDYIEKCLTYARLLNAKDLPVIFDDPHLASLVGYQLSYLRGVSFAGQSYYRSFSVRKRRGGIRQICEPLPSLKEIQHWILREVLDKRKASVYAKGFILGSSIKHNARFHRGQALVVSMDIEDFFPSIKRGRVYGVFRGFGYTRDVSTTLSYVCTLNGSLPQGAPTSPALSNFVARSLDKRIAGFARKHLLRYTRYADDITISGDFRPGPLIRFVRRIVESEGFRLNESKTRAMGRHERQEITGVVVNEAMHAPRTVRRAIRQVAYYVERHGINGHLDHVGDRRRNFVHHILGVANYVHFVNPHDKEAARLFSVIAGLRPNE